MKQVGNRIIGDVVRLEDYTAKWDSLRLHPTTFYRKYAQFQQVLSSLPGLYAQIDAGDFVEIKFSNESDLNNFYKMHNEYI